MSLTNFFRINLPYGIAKNSRGEWIAFNREYMPLGWNSITSKEPDNFENNVYGHLPVYTKYKNISDKKLNELILNNDWVKLDESNKISVIWFYDDRTNPTVSKNWNNYLELIKKLSFWEVESK